MSAVVGPTVSVVGDVVGRRAVRVAPVGTLSSPVLSAVGPSTWRGAPPAAETD